jgi:SAM-dependent methyltransferase
MILRREKKDKKNKMDSKHASSAPTKKGEEDQDQDERLKIISEMYNHRSRMLDSKNGNRKNKSDLSVQSRRLMNYLKRYSYELFVPSHAKVIDFCCGQGGDLHKFAFLRVKEYLGLDISSDAIVEAKLRAKNNVRFQRQIGSYSFEACDLTSQLVSCPSDKCFDVAVCQLALHYLWEAKEADVFLVSLRSCLKSKGIFICTIVDDQNVPKEGIQNHPFVELKWINSDAPDEKHVTGAKWYNFTYAGLVHQMKEMLIDSKQFQKKMDSFGFELIQTFRIRDVFDKFQRYSPNQEIVVSSNDWKILDIYRCYVFQKR